MARLIGTGAGGPLEDVLGGGSAGRSAFRSLLDSDSFDFLSGGQGGAGAIAQGGPATAAAVSAHMTMPQSLIAGLGAAGDMLAMASAGLRQSLDIDPRGAALIAGGAAAEAVAAAGANASAVITNYVSGQGGAGFTSGFNVEIVFQGTWSEALQQAFIVAAEYLSFVIQGDVRNARGGIDDIRLTASLPEIDGVNGILGQAGPTALRFFSKLPSQGVMEFDVADAAALNDEGLFDEVVLHEMMHTLGFGTIWDRLGLTDGSVFGGDMIFTGANAIAAYNAIFGDIAGPDPNSAFGVPVETNGGPGTAGGHWDDGTFGGELMTGYISEVNWVSGMTIASLEDLGYNTVFDAGNADADMIQLDDILAML